MHLFDAEVQALKAEIDRVANTTTFNSQKLLDGSYTSTFQIGDKGGQTVDLSIASVATSALGWVMVLHLQNPLSLRV